MPGFPSLILRLLRHDGRRRRLFARHRHRGHGVGGLRRFLREERDLRRFRRGASNQRRHHRNEAGPSNQPLLVAVPPQPEVPDWPLAGPAAPRLAADESIDPALVAPPPPFWCSEHGWVVCPLHEYGFAVADPVIGAPQEEGVVGAAPLQHPTPAVVEAEGAAPLPMVPTVAHDPAAPRVHVRDGDALAFVSAPTGASVFAFGSGVSGSSSATVVDAVAPPHLPSPTPATPPPSPRSSARRRLLALGVPLASPPSSNRSGRAGTWSPAALELSNGVAPGTNLPGGSSDEEGRGGSSSRRP